MLPRNLSTLLPVLIRASQQLGTDPNTILKKLLEVITNASPRLKFLFSLLGPWAILGLVCYRYLTSFWSSFTKFVSNFLTYSVTIPSDDKLNKQVVAWLGSQGLGENGRHLTTWPMGRIDDRIDHEVKLIPATGTEHFWWRGRHFTMVRGNESKDPEDPAGVISGRYGEEKVTFSCWSLTGANPIKELLEHIKTTIKYRGDSLIRIHQPHHGSWDMEISRTMRSISSVTLDKTVKDNLVKDIARFLDEGTEQWYANRGIPYRRGYLFWGPPGTGKTSFATAVASHFGLDIYMISIASGRLTERDPAGLFKDAPSRCILLLEDINSAGIKRDDMKAEKKPKQTQSHSRRFANYHGPDHPDDEPDDGEEERSSGISLSGLLNALDGVTSKEGRILIMTSNEPDTLDDALIRPGRIDRPVFFSYCTKPIMAEIFDRMYTKTEEEMREDEEASDVDIKGLAKTFVEWIPESALTPAEVQGLL